MSSKTMKVCTYFQIQPLCPPLSYTELALIHFLTTLLTFCDVRSVVKLKEKYR